jgi:hypothetical protein
MINLKSTWKVFNGCQLNLSSIWKENFKDMIELTGYWQSYKYFHESTKDILQQFTFKDQIILHQLKHRSIFHFI